MTNIVSLDCSAPCVSVVVTTYNRSKLLSETVDSILSQSFTDFELIIVDNMSVDGTSEYVAGLVDPRIRYFRNSNNGVIAVNRNYGIQHAKGKYVAFCDDDDLWFPDKLKLQLSLLESNPNVALCYTNAESFVENKVIEFRMVHRKVYQGHFNQLLQGNFIPNSSVLVKSSVLIELGLLTENSNLREDYELWLRLAKNYKMMGIDSSLIRYRVHGSNVAGNRASETLKAIRTVRNVIELLQIPKYISIPNVVYQYVKYIIYRVVGR